MLRWVLVALLGHAGGSRLYVLSHGAGCVDDFEDATPAECYNYFVDHLSGNSSYAVPWVRGGYQACVMDGVQLRSGLESECGTARYCVCIHDPDSGSGEDEDCDKIVNPSEWPDGLHAIVWSLSGLLTVAVATIIVMCCRKRRQATVSIEPMFSQAHTVTEKWELTRPPGWVF